MHIVHLAYFVPNNVILEAWPHTSGSVVNKKDLPLYTRTCLATTCPVVLLRTAAPTKSIQAKVAPQSSKQFLCASLESAATQQWEWEKGTRREDAGVKSPPLSTHKV